MTKKLDLNKLATATGGTVVLANNQKQVEVRMLDGYHTHQGTSQLKLPIVFKGTIDDIREWAKMNHYREVADRASLFGAYFTDRHENSYLLT